MADEYPGAAPVAAETPSTPALAEGGDYPGAAPVGSEKDGAYEAISANPSPYAKAAAQGASGFFERGLGFDQTLNDIGVGKYFPVFRDGKISVGLPPNEELAAREKYIEKNKGSAGLVGEIATDPANLLPFKGGLIKQGAKQGFASSATAPTTDPNKGIGDRAKGTVLGTALGGGTGGIMHAIGGAKEGIIGDMVEAIKAEIGGIMPNLEGKTSELYKQAQKMGISFTGKEKPEEIFAKIQNAIKGKVDTVANNIISGGGSGTNVWAVGTNLATSQMYEGMKMAGGILYTKAAEIGKTQVIPAEEVVTELNSFISAMEKEAPTRVLEPNFNSKLTKIRALRDAIAPEMKEDMTPLEKANAAFNHAGGNAPLTINGAQLIELDRSVNAFYGSKGTGDAESIPANKLKAIFEKATTNMSPEFRDAYSKAKNYWRQNVIQNFENNTVLHKYWKPEDYEAFKGMSKGIELSPELRERAEGLLGNIKTQVDMDELKKALPPQMYDQVRAAKFVTMMDKAGLNSKAIAKDENYRLLVKTLGNKPEDIQALDAIKTFTEEINRRGIKKELTAAELEQSNDRMDRAQRTLFSLGTGHKLYALRHALDFITGKKANPAQERLNTFAKDVVEGGPKVPRDPVDYKPGAVVKTITKPLVTEEGKHTQ